MARIESKFVKIKEAKEEETIIQLSHFGWNKTGELKRENGVVTLSFERRDAPKQMKKLEKDYKKLNKSVPVGGIVIAVLGLLTFIPFAVIDYPIAKYSILSVAVLLLVMGAFFIGAFFLGWIYKAELSKAIIDESDRLAGINKDLPILSNQAKLNAKSEHIKGMVHGKPE